MPQTKNHVTLTTRSALFPATIAIVSIEEEEILQRAPCLVQLATNPHGRLLV